MVLPFTLCPVQVRGTFENNGHGLVFQLTQRVEANSYSNSNEKLNHLTSDHHLHHQHNQLTSNGQKVESNLIQNQGKIQQQLQHSTSNSHHLHTNTLSGSNNINIINNNNNVNHGHHGHHSHISSVNVTGGPLSYTYALDSVHLHFGTSDTKGSEHTIEGIAFPGEVSHLLTINSQVSVER